MLTTGLCASPTNSNAHEDSPKLKWDGLRCIVEDAQSDILLLLDSCAPKDTPATGSHGAKLAIAACAAPDATPREPGARSFTSYLVDSLYKLGNGRPFNARHLYDDILASQQAHEQQQFPPRLPHNGAGYPTAVGPQVPVFLTLAPGKGQNLDLVPMPRNRPYSPPSHGWGGPGSESKPHAAGGGSRPSRDAPVLSPAAVADMVFDEARVLVCTTFVGDAGPDMAYFNMWISNTPALASKVVVEGMFLGPPTVLLISIPQSLWNIIEHDKICFSLGYINSRNLIHLYDGLMKVFTTTPPRVGAPASAKDVEDGRTLLDAREAATKTQTATHRGEYTTPAYQQQPQPQQQHQLPPPASQHLQQQPQQQQPSTSLPLPIHPHGAQTLPLPIPQRQNSQHLPPSLYRDSSSSASQHDPSSGLRPESLSQIQQQPHRQYPSPSHGPPLPPIVSRTGSPVLLPKEESLDSAEMKEAAEQLKALKHIRPVNGNTSPQYPDGGRDHLSKIAQIAQDAIKCQTDDSASEDADMNNTDESASPTKKSKSKKDKDYRFKAAKGQDGQPIRPRSKSDMPSQTLPNLLPHGAKQEVQCDRCSHEPFKDQSSLRKHVASAHTRPFPCAFAFAGCGSTFGSKNEWKRHIASQHLCMQYYRCSDCLKSGIDGKANEFNRKDLFTQHLRRMHAPPDVRKAIQKRDAKVETEWEDYVKEMQKTCCIQRRLPPQRSACPRSECNRLFEGRGAWDEWTEHVGRHLENGEGDSLGVDNLLVSWAVEEGIITLDDDDKYRLSNPMGTGGMSSGLNTFPVSNGHASTAVNGNAHVFSRRSSPNNPGDDAGGSSKDTAGLVRTSTAMSGDLHTGPASSAPQRDEKPTMPPTPPPTTVQRHSDEAADASERVPSSRDVTEGGLKATSPGAGIRREPRAASSEEAAGRAMQAIAQADTHFKSNGKRPREGEEAKGPYNGSNGSSSSENGDSRSEREHDSIVVRQDQPRSEPAKMDEDMAVLQSMAAMAAAAALHQQKNAQLAGGAMDVDR